ncbi:hypothetical protein ACSSS7_000686 [Eimeria intestinalis]
MPVFLRQLPYAYRAVPRDAGAKTPELGHHQHGEPPPHSQGMQALMWAKGKAECQQKEGEEALCSTKGGFESQRRGRGGQRAAKREGGGAAEAPQRQGERSKCPRAAVKTAESQRCTSGELATGIGVLLCESRTGGGSAATTAPSV